MARLEGEHYRITGGPMGYAFKVERNGVLLTNVTGFKVEALAGGVAQVTITEIASIDLDLDIDPLAALRAAVKAGLVYQTEAGAWYSRASGDSLAELIGAAVGAAGDAPAVS